MEKKEKHEKYNKFIDSTLRSNGFDCEQKEACRPFVCPLTCRVGTCVQCGLGQYFYQANHGNLPKSSQGISWLPLESHDSLRIGQAPAILDIPLPIWAQDVIFRVKSLFLEGRRLAKRKKEDNCPLPFVLHNFAE